MFQDSPRAEVKAVVLDSKAHSVNQANELQRTNAIRLTEHPPGLALDEEARRHFREILTEWHGTRLDVENTVRHVQGSLAMRRFPGWNMIADRLGR